jgi:hypothetical protein
MFLRMMLAQYGYDQARRAGMKHASAITEAVSFVRSHCPEMTISETEVKRVVAQLQPKDVPIAYCVSKSENVSIPPLNLPADLCRKFGLPENFNPTHCFTLTLGSRPEYVRNNAKIATSPSAE